MSDGDPKKDDAPERPEADDGMTLWEHLEELRSRIIRMLLAFVVGFGVAWVYREEVFGIITAPFVSAWDTKILGDQPTINFPSPAALFVGYIRLSALAGFAAALPFILWQIWAFIAPGLYSKEKRYAIPFVLTSCGLFAGGSYFGFKVAAPMAFNFLLNIGSGHIGGIEVKPTIMISDYLDFMLRILLAFGLVTELPIVIFFLSVAGLVTPRQLLKFFRYFLVLDFVIAAIITPPDVLSQLLLAIPLAVLYLLSVGIAWLFAKRREIEPEASDLSES